MRTATSSAIAAASDWWCAIRLQEVGMPKSMQMIECKCGDAFDIDSYNAGFTEALGMCPNCAAAETAAKKLTQEGELPPLEPGVYHLDRIEDLLRVPTHRRCDCISELLLALELLEFAVGTDANPGVDGSLVWKDDGIKTVDLDLGNEKLTLTEESDKAD